MTQWLSRSEEETEACGRSLAGQLDENGVLLLVGDLGSGKTVLTRGVAAALGIDPADIQSPTFTVMREHEGERQRLIHIDLYRLRPEEAQAIGLEETLAGDGIKVVEWAERLGFPVAGAQKISFRRGDKKNERIIEKVDI